MVKVKVSTQRSFGWIAPGKQSGLTDVVLTVRKPDGTTITNPTVTEDPNVSGLYVASYTPDVVGVWREEVASVSLGAEVVNAIKVYAVDESDLQTDISGVDTKIDTVEGKIDTVKDTSESNATKLTNLDRGYFI